MNEDKASKYHRLRRRADLLGTALAGLVLSGLAFSSGAQRLRELAAAITQWVPGGFDEALTVAVLTVLVLLVLQVLEFPVAFYQGHLLEHRYGLSTQSAAHWLKDHAKGVLLGLVLAVAGTGVVFAALRNAPDDWWWIAAVVFALATIVLARIAPVVLLPIFYKFKPLDRPPLVDRLMALADRARTDVVGVFEWVLSGHTRRANAALAGLGKTRRILLSDTLLADYSEDEIEVILAHELAHHVHRDLWRGIAVQAVALAAGFFVADLVLRRAAATLDLRGLSDPAALPLLMLVGGAWSLLVMPVANALSRAQERAADRYALTATRNVDAFVTAMKRLSQQNLAEEYPSPLVRLLFYSHPPIRERIEAARAFERGQNA
ncbi:MAG TPA: M48 family metallopeptidase [Vicinamibacterales bacterium]|nr:M48 family metallopeptidase [Vicinamibacterales bacterium]